MSCVLVELSCSLWREGGWRGGATDFKLVTKGSPPGGMKPCIGIVKNFPVPFTNKKKCLPMSVVLLRNHSFPLISDRCSFVKIDRYKCHIIEVINPNLNIFSLLLLYNVISALVLIFIYYLLMSLYFFSLDKAACFCGVRNS